MSELRLSIFAVKRLSTSEIAEVLPATVVCMLLIAAVLLPDCDKAA